MSSTRIARRSALALLASLLTVGIVATAAPASAIPTEGSSGGCVQLVDRDAVGSAGSPLFISFGYALVLDC